MSIIEKLTEGIVNRDMAQEGEALLNKWSATGLLEGLEGDLARNNMARLLENQAKQLLKESSGMSGASGVVDGFAAVAFPIVRRVFAGLIANDLVSVQPMSLPSGLIFFLDFTYSNDLANSSGTAPASRFGNITGSSIYGTDAVGAEIINGVNLVGDEKRDLAGPRGLTGLAYGAATGSMGSTLEMDDADQGKYRATFILDDDIPNAMLKLIEFDPDILSLANATPTHGVIVLDVDENQLSKADFDNLSAFEFTDINLGTGVTEVGSLGEMLNDAAGNITVADIADLGQIRRLTRRVKAADAATNGAAVRFVFVLDTSGSSSITEATTAFAGSGTSANDDLLAAGLQYPKADSAASTTSSGGAITSYEMLLENEAEIPEIDIKVDSTAITAQTKKLKAKWSPELGQDLNAYHNLDAEVELTSILSEQVALEIDREILADLVNGATAGTYYWSRSPGLFVNRVTGAEIGATSAAPDFTGTVSEWYETLIETINDVSAQIHRKTLRGGANFVVCSPEVANILEFTAGFRANVTADADKGEIGAVKVGSLSRKFDVIVDPYFPRNVLLVGRKGASFLESGYVYAPYVPLQVTPTIFGVEDFVPRKGVMTRYAKKMVRPDMYGLVICRGLLGESGAE